MPVEMKPAVIDFGALQQLGTIPERLRQRGYRNDLNSAIDRGDYGAAYDAIIKQNPVAGMELYNRRMAIAQKGAADNKPPKLGAAQYKALYQAENDLPEIDNSVSILERALELNPDTFDGWFAEERANIGARGPEWLSGATGIDKKGSLATEEWSRLMTPEAIKMMGTSFQGATTEKELKTMTDQLSNASTPKPVRDAILRRLIALGKKKQEIVRNRINSLKPYEGVGDASDAASSGMDEGFADEGEEVEGPDGETYVVRGGQLVPQ